VLDAFIDKNLVYKWWLTYGLMVVNLDKSGITYG
jgi:hypothetical protein